MARGIRISLNHSELAKMLKSNEVMDHLNDIADQVVQTTGKPDIDYEIEEWVGVTRARVSIVTATPQARLNEATEHTLLQAVSGMGSGPALIEYTSSRGVTSLRTAAEIANYTRNRT